MAIDNDSSFDVNALFGTSSRKQIVDKSIHEVKKQEDVIIKQPKIIEENVISNSTIFRNKVIESKPQSTNINNDNKDVRHLKERLKKSISYEVLADKIPVLVIGYFDSLYERTGMTVTTANGKSINVTQIAYGPFYNEIDLREWISKIQENFNKKTFVHFEVYSLSTAITKTSLNAIIDKVDINKLEVGSLTYGKRSIEILK